MHSWIMGYKLFEIRGKRSNSRLITVTTNDPIPHDARPCFDARTAAGPNGGPGGATHTFFECGNDSGNFVDFSEICEIF